MFFILRSMQQRDLCNSHYLGVRWGLPYFCSSYFALLCPILKNLSEPAKGYRAWEQCQEGEGRWVKHFPDDGWHHNPKFHLQPSVAARRFSRPVYSTTLPPFHCNRVGIAMQRYGIFLNLQSANAAFLLFYACFPLLWREKRCPALMFLCFTLSLP